MPATPAPTRRPLVVLLPWGNVLEDFLETAEISLDEFLGDFVGSWMFGYVEALGRAGVDVALMCVSLAERHPRRETHAATGAPIVLLPATRTYRSLAPYLENPYGRTVEQVFRQVPRFLRPALTRVDGGSASRRARVSLPGMVGSRSRRRGSTCLSRRGGITRASSRGCSRVRTCAGSTEGFPVALIEAMACGLPPVAADASGVREILGAELASGIVPRDDPEALASGLFALLDDPDGARERGALARRRAVETFGLDRVGAQLRELLIRRREVI